MKNIIFTHPDKQRRSRLLLALSILLLVVVFLSIILSVQGRKSPEDISLASKIGNIKLIHNLSYINPREIESILKPFLGGSLVSLDLNRVEQKLKQHPWVSLASVRRKWPDKLIVKVVEQVPAAKWESGGFINDEGLVFDQKNSREIDGLAVFSGPHGSEKEIFQVYTKLSQAFKSESLKLSRLEKNDIGSYRARLNNNLEVILGRRQLDYRIKRLIRALKSMNKLGVEELKTIDLRYRRGMAVKFFKPGASKNG